MEIKNKEQEIYLVGDTHNIESLKNVLNKFDDIISLGDIGAAVPKEIFLNDYLKKYRKVWKYFSKKEIDVSEEEIAWFKKLNIESWKKQIDNIKESNKNFLLSFGNSDIAMTSFFTECEDYICKNIDLKFKVIRQPEIIFLNNVQIIILPFQKENITIRELIDKIDYNKKIFILSHCPALQNVKKEYYVNNYKFLKEISNKYTKNITFIHGHMHPSNSYKYSIEGLPNVNILTPKAEENFNGFGINNHLIKINTISGEIKLIDSTTDKEMEFQKLPKEYLQNEDHWNEFKEDKK
jgi:hypothetical protein